MFKTIKDTKLALDVLGIEKRLKDLEGITVNFWSGNSNNTSIVIGGQNTNILFNNNGLISGNNNFNWINATNTVNLNGTIQIQNSNFAIFGGDARIRRSAVRRLFVDNTELHAERQYGTVAGGAGIHSTLNILGNLSSDGVGGTPGLRLAVFNAQTGGTNNLGDIMCFSGDIFINGTAGAASTAAVASFGVRVTNAMNVNGAMGFRAIPILTNTGNMAFWIAFESRTPSRTGTGTITGNSIGFQANNMGFTGGGTAIGVQIMPQSGATNNIGLDFPGTTGNVASGIRFVDVEMFRSAANTLALGAGDSLFINQANIVTDTTVGMRIATNAAQRLGFWNNTPIVRPTTTFAPAVFAANTGTAVNHASTFDGYTIGQVVLALRTMGLLA